MTKPILIAGGGIGGVATALALANKGRRSVVLELAPELGEIGAGIQLAPNAFHCFDALGIGERARAEAVFIDKLRLMDGISGEEVVHIPLGTEFRAFFGNPYAVVHRADLHMALLDGCRASGLVDLRTSHRLQSYRQDTDGVTALCEGRDPIVGSALIGADGLRSAVREQMLGDGAPRVSGHTTYRSVIPTERMPEDLRWNAATLWAGPKCHIVHYPLKGWKVFNLVVTFHNDVTEAESGVPVPAEEVMHGFEHLSQRATKIIAHGENWKRWVLCDRDPVATWIDGRVALLGDAAHPMLQYFAQGAAMAMEDAVCLGQTLDAYDDVEQALKAYEAQRVVRTARVQMDSRLIGDYIYHPDGAKALVRDAVMRSMSAQDYYDRLAWLYGGPSADRSVAVH
jgi:2-polyprenyl-6-methoxyphenol hydroxylase-like FAD-dependent oxidoreductase